jgi:hypothetical protein
MKEPQGQQKIRKNSNARITSCLFVGSVLIIYVGFTSAYGIEVFSKDDKPFGVPYDEWLGKYWNWWISVTPEQSEPPNGSCLIHKSNSTLMLLDPSIAGKHELECDISSKDGIMIASWNGFQDNNNKDPIPDNTPVGQLSKMAKQNVNFGAVTSEVTVDGKKIAKLDEITTKDGGYKINTMENFTEIYAKPFNITIPETTYMPDQAFGTWPSGAQGWFTFLKPLPPGDHKVTYSLSVQGLGADNVASENTYTFHVK